MRRVKRSASVPYSAEQMFELVNDVESYPEFLHWCRGAGVESRGDDEMIASLDIGISGLHKSFRTRNRLVPPEPGTAGRVEIALLSGPFRRLSGAWTFANRPVGGCDVTLELDYELERSPLVAIFAAVFGEIARSQMDAFVKRAGDLYARA